MHIDRRQLLQGSAGLLAACGLPGRAMAFDPATLATAIKFAEFALGAAKLFQGSSTSGPGNLDVRLLVNLSQQLRVVQDGIILILQQLAEIRQIISEVPAEVVQELTTRNLAGKFITYNELLTRYAALGQDLRAFRREKGEQTRQLINDIASSSRTLITYKKYVNIPILSSSLAVEYECRRWLGETDAQLIPVMQTYGSYFKDVLYGGAGSLEKMLQEVRTSRSALFDVIRNPRLFQSRGRVISDMGNSAYVALGYVNFDIKTETGAFDAQLDELLQLGLISRAELPISLSYRRRSRTVGRIIGYVSDGDPTDGTSPPMGQTVPALPTTANALRDAQTMAQQMEDEANLNARRIYALSSCFHSGARSLNFCQQFDG